MASPLYNEMLPMTEDLLGNEILVGEDCEMFMNSSCALSPNSPTEILSPEHEYENFLSTDPLGLNDLFGVDDTSHDDEVASSTSSPVNDYEPTAVSRVHNTRQVSGKKLPANAKIVKVYPSDVVKGNNPKSDEYAVMDKRGSIKFSVSSVSGGKKSDENRCMNRNAVNARENRERKKRYIADLEKSVSRLSKENRALKERMAGTDSVIAKLEKELKYCKSIIANQGPLSSILGGLLKVQPEMKVRAPILGTFPTEADVVVIEEEKENERLLEPEEQREKEAQEFAERYPKRKRVAKAKDFPPMKCSKKTPSSTPTSLQMDHCYNKKNTAAGGICLHISHDDVSVEMCADCSESAQRSLACGQ